MELLSPVALLTAKFKKQTIKPIDAFQELMKSNDFPANP